MENIPSTMLLLLLVLTVSTFLYFSVQGIIEKTTPEEKMRTTVLYLQGYRVEGDKLLLFFTVVGEIPENVSLYLDGNLVRRVCEGNRGYCVIELNYPRNGGDLTISFPNGQRFRLKLPPLGGLTVVELRLPSGFEVNNPATIEVNICNETGKDTSDTLRVYLDANEMNSTSLSLSPSSCSWEEISFTPTESGEHVLKVVTTLSSLEVNIFVGALIIPYLTASGPHTYFSTYEMISVGPHTVFSTYELVSGGPHTFFSTYELIVAGPYTCPIEYNCYVT